MCHHYLARTQDFMHSGQARYKLNRHPQPSYRDGLTRCSSGMISNGHLSINITPTTIKAQLPSSRQPIQLKAGPATPEPWESRAQLSRLPGSGCCQPCTNSPLPSPLDLSPSLLFKGSLPLAHLLRVPAVLCGEGRHLGCTLVMPTPSQLRFYCQSKSE